jgi:hypothetical protein
MQLGSRRISPSLAGCQRWSDAAPNPHGLFEEPNDFDPKDDRGRTQVGKIFDSIFKGRRTFARRGDCAHNALKNGPRFAAQA